MNCKQRRVFERRNVRMLGKFIDLVDSQIFEWANNRDITKSDILNQLDIMRREFKTTFGKGNL